MNVSQTLKTKVVIILAGTVDLDLQAVITNNDYLIAVDGGLNHLVAAGLHADVLIGDLDSVTETFAGPTIKYEPIKDETDFHLAINYANLHFPNLPIEVYGFNSLDRIDHVLANLATIESNIKLISDNQQVILIASDYQVMKDQYKYYSFFSLEPIQQFSLSGFAYPLADYRLEPFDPLCVSNQLVTNSGTIKISNGRLLIIKSKRS